MIKSVLLGVIFGVMVLTGIAVAYNQFHVETTPDANVFSMFTDKQMAQIEAGESINSIELEQSQVDDIIKTIEYVNEYEIELTEAERILLEQIIETKVREVSQNDVNLLKKELADGLLKMGLNLKPEMIESLEND